MNNILDTIMNIEVFVFIGLLIWLYFKPDKKDPKEEHERNSSFQ